MHGSRLPRVTNPERVIRWRAARERGREHEKKPGGAGRWRNRQAPPGEWHGFPCPRRGYRGPVSERSLLSCDSETNLNGAERRRWRMILRGESPSSRKVWSARAFRSLVRPVRPPARPDSPDTGFNPSSPPFPRVGESGLLAVRTGSHHRNYVISVADCQ